MSQPHAMLSAAASKCGADGDDVAMAAGALSITTLFTVFLQLLPILASNAPAVFGVIVDVINTLRAGTFSWATWAELYAKDGPVVLAAFKAIAAALGIPLPLPGPIVP